MRLFIENDQIGSPFEIKVHFWDTVLDIKEKIVETQRIPLHKQTLFFQGKLLEDDLYVEQCLIKHKSLLQLLITPEHISNHSNEQGPQLQQSPLPSTDELLNNQDSPVKVPQTENQDSGQDSSLMFGRNDNSQALQSEKYPVPSNSIGSNLYGEDLPSTAEQSRNIHSMPTKTEEIINQDSQMTVGSNKNPVLQTDLSPASDSIKDSHVKKQSKPDPRKLRVLVLPFRAEEKIPVEVNENDNVEELRKELVEMQKRSQLNLPQEGYFFKHKQRILYDHQSFQLNCVSHGDTVEILPRHVERSGKLGL